MPDDDVDDAVVDFPLGGLPIEPGPDDDVSEPGNAFVCDHVGDDGVCGATFDTENKLKMHKVGKHRDRSGDKKPAPRGSSRARTTRDRKPSTKRAAAAASAPHTDRASVYSASLATFGLGAYLAIPSFDKFDLDCITAGAPNLAAALDAVGEQNKSVRAACDLALGGGTGGAYVQLILAALAMGVPIAAHHGWLPDSAGNRFGEMISVAVPSPEPGPQSPATAPGPAADGTYPVPQTADEVFTLMEQVEPTVMFDVASRMMSMGGPVVVDVPDAFTHVAQPENADGEHGPEQLAPEPVTVS
jgi:hypothetical protein